MTPETVRTGLLEPALDARALNLQQERLIANPTAEVDSVIEHLAELHRHATSDTQRHHITQVAQLVDTLLISNRVEGGLEQQIAGRADTLAAALQCDQVTGGHWSARRVIRELRDPLAVLTSPIIVGPRRAVALALVRDVLAAAPRGVVLSPTVARQYRDGGVVLLVADTLDGLRSLADSVGEVPVPREEAA